MRKREKCNRVLYETRFSKPPNVTSSTHQYPTWKQTNAQSLGLLLDTRRLVLCSRRIGPAGWQGRAGGRFRRAQADSLGGARVVGQLARHLAPLPLQPGGLLLVLAHHLAHLGRHHRLGEHAVLRRVRGRLVNNIAGFTFLTRSRGVT